MANRFFREFRIQLIASVHQLLNDNCHLNNKFKLLFFLFFCHLQFRWVLIKSDGTCFFCPFQSLLKLFVIINAFCHTTDDLYLIHRLYTHSKVGLDEIRVNNGTADTHTDRTDLQPGFTSHRSNCNCCTSESKHLFFNIFRHLHVICIQNLMSVNTKCRKSFLCMCSKNRCQIYSSRSFCCIKAPDCLNSLWIHIHCLRTVAPAWSNSKGNVYALSSELISTCC